MKLSFAYGFIMILILCSGSIFLNGDNPEQLILGKWEEVSWELERVDKDRNQVSVQLEELQKKEIYKNLIIHQAEIWEFLPQKQLMLKQADSESETKLNWTMKGRGHILELKYKDLPSETYQVYQLNEDELVMYFNFNLQMRGMVKMTFKRVEDNSYAKKI